MPEKDQLFQPEFTFASSLSSQYSLLAHTLNHSQETQAAA
jgi:hypothetical protein